MDALTSSSSTALPTGPIVRGCCSGCNMAIWNIDPKTNRIKGPLSNYREFFFVTHIEDLVKGKVVVRNGSERMNRHAICSSCINILTDQNVSRIFERIRSTWRLSMVGSAVLSDFERLNALKVVCWDTDEKACEKKYYG